MITRMPISHTLFVGFSGHGNSIYNTFPLLKKKMFIKFYNTENVYQNIELQYLSHCSDTATQYIIKIR